MRGKEMTPLEEKEVVFRYLTAKEDAEKLGFSLQCNNDGFCIGNAKWKANGCYRFSG